MSNATIPDDLIERILDYLPRDALLFALFSSVSRLCYKLSSRDKYWSDCWDRKYIGARPQQNCKYAFIQLQKYLKKHSQEKPTTKPHVEEIKILMVGSSKVGKSCVWIQFMENIFVEQYDPTMCVFERHLLTISREQNYRKYLNVCEQNFSIYVTETQNEIPQMNEHLFRTAYAYILVFSLTDKQSLLDLDALTRSVYTNRSHVVGGLPIVLIGNKKDCTHVITQDEIDKFMKRWDIRDYFETSAKTAENVQAAYQRVCELYVPKRVHQYEPLIRKWEMGHTKDKKCILM
jgi:small GTP-binding protein